MATFWRNRAADLATGAAAAVAAGVVQYFQGQDWVELLVSGGVLVAALMLLLPLIRRWRGVGRLRPGDDTTEP